MDHIVLACPECSARFRVKAAALGKKGRVVKCVKCQHKWHAAAHDDAAPLAKTADKAASADGKEKTGGEAGKTEAAQTPSVTSSEKQPSPSVADSGSDSELDSGADAEQGRDDAQGKDAQGKDAEDGKDTPSPHDSGESESETDGGDQGDGPSLGESENSDNMDEAGSGDDENGEAAEDETGEGDEEHDADAQGDSDLPPEVKKSKIPAIMWAALVLFVVILALVLFAFQKAVVTAFPPAHRLYHMIGIPVDVVGHGLVLSDPKATVRYGADDVILSITGTVTNETNEILEIPLLQGTLVDTENKTVHVWTFKAETKRIVPHETVKYTTNIIGPPPNVSSAEITFITAQEQDE